MAMADYLFSGGNRLKRFLRKTNQKVTGNEAKQKKKKEKNKNPMEFKQI